MYESLSLKFLGPLILTAAPTIIVPILLVWDAAPYDGWNRLATTIAVTILMAIYLVVGALICLFLRRWEKTRPAGLGVAWGLAAGVILGVSSCSASQAVFL